MNVLKRIIKINFVFLLLISLQSCGGVKLTGTKSPSGKLTESFYVGDGITQYHIKNQELSSDFDSSKNEFDLTFRVNDSKNNLCTVNFTIISDFEITTEAKLDIQSNSKPIFNIDLDVIYNEKAEDKIINRVSAKVDYNHLMEAFKTDALSFKFYNNNNTIILKPTSKTIKNFEKLRASVFD